MSFNIPKVPAKRVVVVGGGFGGLKLCSKLAKSQEFQVVLIDKNNFHQFPPLIYQIATAGLQVSSITFPFRKLFENSKNFYFRMCSLRAVYPKERYIQTSIGKLEYDYLIIATGTTTNYFGNQSIEDASLPMKTVSESLGLRNALLDTFERASTCATEEERQDLLNVVIVGGGPTGVEIAGALAEMKQHVLPRDYPDLDTNLFKIHLLQGADRLLPAMSKTASAASLTYLQELGIDVQLNARVIDYKDHEVLLHDGRKFKSLSVIWVCGIIGNKIEGLDQEVYGSGRRLKVDRFNQVEGYDRIYAIGDCALMKSQAYPYGHPQMAQAAIQQGAQLAENLIRKEKGQALKPFSYRDLGSMATIGRNKAVADIAGLNLTGFTAWFIWMAVHLMSILGVRNKLMVLLDWAWSYITYDKSNRTLISVKHPKVIVERNYAISKRHWGLLSKQAAEDRLYYESILEGFTPAAGDSNYENKDKVDNTKLTETKKESEVKSEVSTTKVESQENSEEPKTVEQEVKVVKSESQAVKKATVKSEAKSTETKVKAVPKAKAKALNKAKAKNSKEITA